ncbi:MAG TPA: dephospho-CoA kinase, partial [Acidimicrobiales bacterium]|nr:dephospho-CoA kinase [Acidimicrobiales bacterium]
TVSDLLSRRGAVVIDADLVTREVQAPGGPAYQGIVDRFGGGIVAVDGTIDRPALAKIVFNDADALAKLNSLTHPHVGRIMAERMAGEADTDHVVVLDVPLLVESSRRQPAMAGVIVVDAPEDVAVARVVRQRGMAEADARARIAAQASRRDRLARADFVVDNSGSIPHLQAEVDRCWAWIEGLGSHAPGKPSSP